MHANAVGDEWFNLKITIYYTKQKVNEKTPIVKEKS